MDEREHPTHSDIHYRLGEVSGKVESLQASVNWAAVPETLKLYRNPGTNVEAGLLRRRVAEGELFSTGKWSKA